MELIFYAQIFKLVRISFFYSSPVSFLHISSSYISSLTQIMKSLANQYSSFVVPSICVNSNIIFVSLLFCFYVSSVRCCLQSERDELWHQH